MQIDTSRSLSMTEARQDFSKAIQMVSENGLAVIQENSISHYVVMDYLQFEEMKNMQNKWIEFITEKILRENLEAFEELAK